MSIVPRHSLVVIGATGAIGQAVVDAAVKAAQPVIAVARNAAALEALRERHPGADLAIVDASVGSDGEAAALAQRLRDLDRPVSGVVAAIRGDIERGRLLDQPEEFLRRRLDEDLLPHLFAARHLLPLLAEHGHGGYVLIGGPGAEHPWAGYGHYSIGAAALRMLARVLHDEARTLPVRVQLLAIDSPARTDANARHACSNWPGADSIAQRVLALLDPQDRRPPQAVVSYDAQPLGFDLWSDDIDGPPAGTPVSRAAPPGSTGTQEHPQEHPQEQAQETERPHDPLPARCLQDARSLLGRLGAPDADPDQEPEPEPKAKPNQETSPR